MVLHTRSETPAEQQHMCGGRKKRLADKIGARVRVGGQVVAERGDMKVDGVRTVPSSNRVARLDGVTATLARALHAWL